MTGDRRVDVLIATFKRPTGLSRLLDELDTALKTFTEKFVPSSAKV